MDVLKITRTQAFLLWVLVAFSLAFGVTVLTLTYFKKDLSSGDYGTLLASFITFVALIVAILGYVENQKTKRLEYRAYLRVDKVIVAELKNGCLRVALELANLGRTPATEVEISGVVNIEHLPTATTMGHKQLIAKIPFVNCGTPLVFEADTLGGFAADVVDRVRTGDAKLSLHLAVSYLDAFGDAHHEPAPFHFSGTDDAQNLKPLRLV